MGAERQGAATDSFSLVKRGKADAKPHPFYGSAYVERECAGPAAREEPIPAGAFSRALRSHVHKHAGKLKLGTLEQ